LDNYEYSELLKKLSQQIDNAKSIIKPDKIKVRLDEIQTIEQDPLFWNDPDNAAIIQKEKTKISNIYNKYEKASNALTDAQELFEMGKEEDDQDTIDSLFEEADVLEGQIGELEIEVMLSG